MARVEQLTRHFMRREFVCPCCEKSPVDSRFIRALQELRDISGKPITVLSGYRCISHNIEVGGSRRSYHTHGRAADIRISCCSMADMYHFAEMVDDFKNGGIGLYDGGFLHVDNRGHKAARWGRIDGQYIDFKSAHDSLCGRLREAEDDDRTE